MGGLSITNAQFSPFSMDELMRGPMMATQAQIIQEKTLTDLSDKAAVLEYLKNSEQDQESYKIYKDYQDSLNSAMDDLATNGFSGMKDRRALYSAKQRYMQDIFPRERAIERRRQLNDEIMKNPDLLYSADVGNMSIEEFVRNPEFRPKTYSSQALEKKAMAVGQALSKAFEGNEEYLDPNMKEMYYHIKNEYGITRDDYTNFISGNYNKIDHSKFEALRHSLSNILYSTGIDKWDRFNNDKDFETQVGDIIKSGLAQAIGTTQIQHLANSGYGASTNADRISKPIRNPFVPIATVRPLDEDAQKAHDIVAESNKQIKSIMNARGRNSKLYPSEYYDTNSSSWIGSMYSTNIDYLKNLFIKRFGRYGQFDKYLYLNVNPDDEHVKAYTGGDKEKLKELQDDLEAQVKSVEDALLYTKSNSGIFVEGHDTQVISQATTMGPGILPGIKKKVLKFDMDKLKEKNPFIHEFLVDYGGRITNEGNTKVGIINVKAFATLFNKSVVNRLSNKMEDYDIGDDVLDYTPGNDIKTLRRYALDKGIITQDEFVDMNDDSFRAAMQVRLYNPPDALMGTVYKLDVADSNLRKHLLTYMEEGDLGRISGNPKSITYAPVSFSLEGKHKGKLKFKYKVKNKSHTAFIPINKILGSVKSKNDLDIILSKQSEENKKEAEKLLKVIMDLNNSRMPRGNGSDTDEWAFDRYIRELRHKHLNNQGIANQLGQLISIILSTGAQKKNTHTAFDLYDNQQNNEDFNQ